MIGEYIRLAALFLGWDWDLAIRFGLLGIAALGCLISFVMLGGVMAEMRREKKRKDN